MNYSIVLRNAEGPFPIVLDNGDRVSITLRPGTHSTAYEDIKISGFVSDHLLTDFSGELAFTMKTDTASLNVPKNLYPSEDGFVMEVNSSMAMLSVYKNLTGEFKGNIGIGGTLYVMRNLDGSEEELLIGSDAMSLSIARMTVISDWSEAEMDSLEEMSLDEMIYLEV